VEQNIHALRRELILTLEELANRRLIEATQIEEEILRITVDKIKEELRDKR